MGEFSFWPNQREKKDIKDFVPAYKQERNNFIAYEARIRTWDTDTCTREWRQYGKEMANAKFILSIFEYNKNSKHFTS